MIDEYDEWSSAAACSIDCDSKFMSGNYIYRYGVSGSGTRLEGRSREWRRGVANRCSGTMDLVKRL